MATYFSLIIPDSFCPPDRLSNPFTETADPAAQLAAAQFRAWAETQAWYSPLFQQNQGKMFGVLVFIYQESWFYLATCSGKLNASPTATELVGPIVPRAIYESVLNTGARRLDRLNAEYQGVSSLLQSLATTTSEENLATLEMWRMAISERKVSRQQYRADIQHCQIPLVDPQHLKRRWDQQSQRDKRQWKSLLSMQREREVYREKQVQTRTSWLSAIETERVRESKETQRKLFELYQLKNVVGETKPMLSLFSERLPSSGTGDCAAPKLLQHAFENNLRPVALAEFWIGSSASSGVRQDGCFYPPCRGRCGAILPWMLSGMLESVDQTTPITDQVYSTEHLNLKILFEDDELWIIEKPAGLLSVPGKRLKDSVQARLALLSDDKPSEVHMVHRLDMDTSGILVVARTKIAHKFLQKQFINREVNKIYEALLVGEPARRRGTIDLPLRPDIDDRPRQIVCHISGKSSTTHYEVVGQKNVGRQTFTRVRFCPVTGRSHQIRLHAAHQEGLGVPIVGDPLYSSSTMRDRMCLHASELTIRHPTIDKAMTFSSAVPF